MKKYLLTAAVLMAGCSAPAFAGLSQIGQDIYDQTQVTILKSANVAYFYDLGEGSDRTAQAGIIDHVLSYKFLSASLGWRTPTAGGTGILVGGPSVRLDKMADFFFPSAVTYINSFIPNSAQKFWDSLFIGIDQGWSVDNGAPSTAFHAGLAFTF